LVATRVAPERSDVGLGLFNLVCFLFMHRVLMFTYDYDDVSFVSKKNTRYCMHEV
jgi:hypothetical protein